MTELFLAQHVNSDKYFTCGSSRKLLSDFFAYLDREKSNISELYLCLYLYNNSVLHQKMKEMAESGISVKVISIPLEGYDANYPKKIVDPDTGNTVFQNATKYSLAKRVYDDAARLDNQNFSLYLDILLSAAEDSKTFPAGRFPTACIPNPSLSKCGMAGA